MSNPQLLIQVAEVLEKTAVYFEEIEAQKVNAVSTARKTAAASLIEKLSEATGEVIETDVAEKLSQLDPEISRFLGKIAGEQTEVESMGGPKETTNTKTASDGGSDAADRFFDWIVGP
jgi:hypothetical protein